MNYFHFSSKYPRLDSIYWILRYMLIPSKWRIVRMEWRALVYLTIGRKPW